MSQWRVFLLELEPEAGASAPRFWDFPLPFPDSERVGGEPEVSEPLVAAEALAD